MPPELRTFSFTAAFVDLALQILDMKQPKHSGDVPLKVNYSVRHLLMMAMSELKLPMLKHSCATSMKNSMMRARCFFFTGCCGETPQKENDSVTTKT